MPIKPFRVNLANVGTTELAPPGVRINAVSVTELTAPAMATFKLGNNPAFTVLDTGRLRIGSDALPSDAKQGFWVENPIAQAGAFVAGIISYTRAGDKGVGPDAAVDYGT
ncbi:MAG: hypothetical protein KF822_12475 [Steroidobacteraceae bacterium]|nr:hypothetical protein [Steroidobacteraceae bacterium]